MALLQRATWRKGHRVFDKSEENELDLEVVGRTLTIRERDVFRLVSQGLANKVVARQLGVREGTVKIHLHSIYRKLRVANRAGLILSANAHPQQSARPD
jgi:DNA-binding NarL/FixJ family response regulator